VTREAQPFTEAIVDVNGQEQRLRDQDLQGTYVHTTDKDEDITEYVATVEWAHTRPQGDAFWAVGLFANQNSACPLRSSFTIDTLTRNFQLDTQRPRRHTQIQPMSTARDPHVRSLFARGH
jgi:hypothetical protein